MHKQIAVYQTYIICYSNW